MSSRRVLKAAQAIREVVSMAIIADLKDPRIKDVTVTLVEVAPDMRQAKVHVSVMGDETKQGPLHSWAAKFRRLPAAKSRKSHRYAIHPTASICSRQGHPAFAAGDSYS